MRSIDNKNSCDVAASKTNLNARTFIVKIAHSLMNLTMLVMVEFSADIINLFENASLVSN